MNQSPEEGPRGDHDRPAGMEDVGLIDDAADPPILNDETLHEALKKVKARLLLQHGLHCETVKLLVALETGGLDGRPFGSVQQPEVDGGLVGNPPHLTAQGVDLLDELALGQTADRGVAGHQRNRVQADVEEQGFAAHSGRRERGFAARMSSPDNDDVIFPIHGFLFPCSKEFNMDSVAFADYQ